MPRTERLITTVEDADSGETYNITRVSYSEHWETYLICSCGWSFSCTTLQTEDYQLNGHIKDHEQVCA